MTIDEKFKLHSNLTFEEFFNKYKNIYRNQLHYYTKTVHTTDDIITEAFIDVFRFIDNYDSSKSLFTSWVNQIVINKCFTLYKLENRHNKADNVTYIEDLAIKEDEFDEEKYNNIMYIINNKIKAEHKEVIFLKDIEQKTHDEISILLNLNKNTVKSRLFIARKKVKDIYFQLFEK